MPMPMMVGMQILCGVEVSTEMELSELTRPPTNLKMHQTAFFDDNGDNDDDGDHDDDGNKSMNMAFMMMMVVVVVMVAMMILMVIDTLAWIVPQET